MTRTMAEVIEFQDGTLVDVLMWIGPGFEVQWFKSRVCNEMRDAQDKHWVKVEGTYEDEDTKMWVPRWRVREHDLVHGEWREDVRYDTTHFPVGSLSSE